MMQCVGVVNEQLVAEASAAAIPLVALLMRFY
jgi:hypothetical protein